MVLTGRLSPAAEAIDSEASQQGERYLMRLAAVVLGDGGEGGLGLPGHVGVGISSAALQHLDDAQAGQIQVETGIAIGAGRKAVEREEEHEGAVDALRIEDLQRLGQVRGLASLVADVLPFSRTGVKAPSSYSRISITRPPLPPAPR